MKLLSVLFLMLLFSPINYTIEVENNSIYEEACRYNIQGWIYVHIEGEAYERGYQHGYLLFAEIADVIYRWSNMIHNSPYFLGSVNINQTSENYAKISNAWWNYCKKKAMNLFGDKFP